MITLYDYQEKAFSDLRACYASGFRAPLLVLPTGGGKTVVFTYAAKKAQEKRLRVLLLAHRRELVGQISEALKLWGVDHGVIRTDTKPTSHSVQVGMVQTLANRIKLDKQGRYVFDLVIVDEAHHATTTSTWGTIIAHNPKAKLLGVTATPCRLDGKGLGVAAQGFFDVMVMGPTVQQLIDMGKLARPVVYSPANAVDLSGVKKRGGDYISAQLAGAMDKSHITGDAVIHYRRYCHNESAIAFTVTIDHAAHVVQQYKQAGYQAAVLTGTTPDKERAEMIRDLGNNSLHILASCNVVSEGTDIPSVKAAILLRPTESYALDMQQKGRAMRAFAGKDKAIILDHADNTRRHGLPTDDVEWSLEGITRKSKQKKGSSLVKTCNGCGALVGLRTVICADCGYKFHAAVSLNEGVEVREGELIEMTPAMIEELRQRKRKELISARSKEQLVQLGRERNYKNPSYWADKIIEDREQYRSGRQGAAHG